MQSFQHSMGENKNKLCPSKLILFMSSIHQRIPINQISIQLILVISWSKCLIKDWFSACFKTFRKKNSRCRHFDKFGLASIPPNYSISIYQIDRSLLKICVWAVNTIHNCWIHLNAYTNTENSKWVIWLIWAKVNHHNWIHLNAYINTENSKWCLTHLSQSESP